MFRTVCSARRQETGRRRAEHTVRDVEFLPVLFRTTQTQKRSYSYMVLPQAFHLSYMLDIYASNSFQNHLSKPHILWKFLCLVWTLPEQAPHSQLYPVSAFYQARCLHIGLTSTKETSMTSEIAARLLGHESEGKVPGKSIYDSAQQTFETHSL